MDAFDFSHIQTAKRSTKQTRYNFFSGIAKTLRILEFCVALFFLSWILTRLPFVLRVSADYLRSPLFVFAISNAIIAALLAQSARFTAAADDRYSDSTASVAEEIRDTGMEKNSGVVVDSDSRKVCRRSQSEKLKEKEVDESETARPKLRRSETEKAPGNIYPQDKLSNEEFRRTIEAFIAKQMRFLREESLDILVQSSEPTSNQLRRPKLLSN